MKLKTLPVAPGSKGCLHSIAQTHTSGNSTQRIAEPCVVKVHKSRKPVHRTANNVKWS